MVRSVLAANAARVAARARLQAVPRDVAADTEQRRRVVAVVEQSWHRVPGGTAVSTVRTLDAMATRAEWDVVGIAAAHRFAAHDMASPTVPVVHHCLPRRALYDAWHRFRRPALRSAVGSVDVVHATGGVVPPPGDAALVVTVHDLAFLRRPEHFTPRGVRFMTRSLELTIAEAHRVIVPSESTAAECRDAGLDADRLRVVPWGVTASSVNDGDRGYVRERFGLPDRFVLWVGAAEPRKNLAGLVAALNAATADVPLIMSGSGGWNVDIAALLAEAPPGIRHLGEVDARDLPVLYDLADAFIYPSLQEGFGMPVLEAMAQGTPVITSSGTATEEVAGDCGLLVDPFDVDALADAFDRLVGDDALRVRLGEAGRERAAEFSWAATAAATEAIYSEAVSRRATA